MIVRGETLQLSFLFKATLQSPSSVCHQEGQPSNSNSKALTTINR
jgi:hypothetical protein